MSSTQIVGDYLKTLFSGNVRPEQLRDFLDPERFEFIDPMMSASSADDYIGQLKAFGDELQLHAEVRQVVAQGDIVAALVDFQGPRGAITYALWFTLRNGKITRLEVVYDPRAFLEVAAD